MKTMRWVFPVLVAVSLALTSCAKADPPAGAPFILAPDEASDIQREALVDGELALRDGCFLLISSDAEWLIEWPYGTALGDDGASVDVGDTGTVRVGDTIRGGGGYSEQTQECAIDGLEGTVSIDTITEIVPGED